MYTLKQVGAFIQMQFFIIKKPKEFGKGPSTHTRVYLYKDQLVAKLYAHYVYLAQNLVQFQEKAHLFQHTTASQTLQEA